MYKEIIEARYTNPQQDTILVLHETESDGIIEEYIQPGSIQHEAIEEHGWTEEKLIDATAEFKKEQLAELNQVAKLSAAQVYQKEQEEQERLLQKNKKRALEMEALIKVKQEERSRITQRVLEMESLIKIKQDELTRVTQKVLEKIALEEQKKKKLIEQDAIMRGYETKAAEKIRSINKYVTNNVGTEKMDVAIDNFITFINVIVDDEEALAALKKRTGAEGENVKEVLKNIL